MSHVSVQPTGCWLWTGALENGYGRFQLNGKQVRMPRAAWIVNKGPIPKGYEPDHLCRVRACVNTDHMELVTHLINVRRGDAGKRMRDRTHCPQGHEYTPDNTQIKTSGARRCRTCARKADFDKRRARGSIIRANITHCPHGHEYTPQNTGIGSAGGKFCRVCCRERARIKSRKKRQDFK